MNRSSPETAAPAPRPANPPRAGRRWRVSLVTLLLLCFAVEAGWRIYLFRFASEYHLSKWARTEDIDPAAVRYVPDPYTLYRNNPNYVSRSGLRRHNSLGFRGGEFPIAKPEGELRIACVGGSTTYDTAIEDDRQTFCAQLQEVLREAHGHEGVHVINGGVGGYNSWETLAHVQMRVLELEPDVLIVYHATNDVHARLVPRERYRRDNSGHRKPWSDEQHWWDRSLFLHHVGVQWGFSQSGSLGRRTKVRYEKDLDQAACLAANPPTFFCANLANIVALARARGTRVLLTSWAHSPHLDDYAATDVYQQGFREMNAASRSVAEEHDVPYYDFAAEMPQDPEYWADGRHNNAAGARLKAERFAAFLDTNLLDS